MRLIQIPFSHNCFKVRRALQLKGLPHETLDIRPMDRGPVVAASGQGLVPALEDDRRCIHDSTAILLHLETTHPEPSLLPEDPTRHAECWLIEDWADCAFMEMTRRMAYWRRLQVPGSLAERFFPEARGLKRRLMTAAARRTVTRRFRLSAARNARDEQEAPGLARLALERLAGKPVFFDRVTVADIALAAMIAPLWVAGDHVRNDPAVRELLEWGRPILGGELLAVYGVAAPDP